MNRKLAEITPPKAQFPVVLAGGSTLPEGFIKMFERKLREANLPINISNIKLAKDPLYSVARGCLIAARTHEGDNVLENVPDTNEGDNGEGEEK